MSVLTKVFVVLVTILSILLVALVVPFVHNTQDYKTQLTQEKTLRATAETRAGELQAQITSLQQNQSEQAQKLQAQVNSLTLQITNINQKLADAEQQLAAARGAQQAATADVSRLTAINEQSTAQVTAMTSELKERRANDIKNGTKMVNMADRITELTSQLESLQRVNRRYQEQLAAAEDANSKLHDLWAKVPDSVRSQILQPTQGQLEIVPAVPIYGKVAQVIKQGGDTLVQINVGSSDGVSQNMKFYVYRGTTFLAKLIVRTVQPRESAGMLSLIQGDVKAGDSVYAGPVGANSLSSTAQ